MAGLTRLSQQTRLGLTGVRLFSSAHQVPFFPQICMLCTCVFCWLRIWVCDSNGQTHCAACVSHRRSNSACLEEVPLHDTRYTWQSHCLEVLFCDWHDQTHCAACASYRRSTLACPPRLPFPGTQRTLEVLCFCDSTPSLTLHAYFSTATL